MASSFSRPHMNRDSGAHQQWRKDNGNFKRIAEGLLGIKSQYGSLLIVQWQLSPWLGVLQAAAVLAVWTHACIGVHFWLRTKAWYARWQVLFVGFGLLLPTLALTGVL